MQKIKVIFSVPTKDLKKSESILLPVTMNIPKNKEVVSNIEFSVRLPDFMFDELADTEPKFKTTYDINNREYSGLFSGRTLQRKFKKTQTALLVEQLQSYFRELTYFINDKHSVESHTMKKKIFISFNHSSDHTRNNLNGAYTGEETKQKFKYFTGYEVMTDKFSNFSLEKKVTKKYISKIMYVPKFGSTHHLDTGFKEVDDLFLPLTDLNESVKSFESRYSIIDWTEEREEFCEKIRLRFLGVNEQLDNFLKDINDDKIELMMSDFEQKILLPK